MTAPRKFIEWTLTRCLVSVKLLDQHRVVMELVGPAFDLVDFKDAAIKQGPEEHIGKTG